MEQNYIEPESLKSSMNEIPISLQEKFDTVADFDVFSPGPSPLTKRRIAGDMKLEDGLFEFEMEAQQIEGRDIFKELEKENNLEQIMEEQTCELDPSKMDDLSKYRKSALRNTLNNNTAKKTVNFSSKSKSRERRTFTQSQIKVRHESSNIKPMRKTEMTSCKPFKYDLNTMFKKKDKPIPVAPVKPRIERKSSNLFLCNIYNFDENYNKKLAKSVKNLDTYISKNSNKAHQSNKSIKISKIPSLAVLENPSETYKSIFGEQEDLTSFKSFINKENKGKYSSKAALIRNGFELKKLMNFVNTKKGNDKDKFSQPIYTDKKKRIVCKSVGRFTKVTPLKIEDDKENIKQVPTPFSIKDKKPRIGKFDLMKTQSIKDRSTYRFYF